MMRLVYEGLIYSALLVNCYDGDTCRVRFDGVPPFLREQRVRFTGIDAPEIRGACAQEKDLARRARAVTKSYVAGGGKLFVADGRDRYGRLLVNAPRLNAKLIEAGLARPYAKGRRGSWC